MMNFRLAALVFLFNVLINKIHYYIAHVFKIFLLIAFLYNWFPTSTHFKILFREVHRLPPDCLRGPWHAKFKGAWSRKRKVLRGGSGGPRGGAGPCGQGLDRGESP